MGVADEDSIINEFLAFPRGGAVSGASATARKREQISKLVGIIQEWGNGLDEGEDDAVLKQQVSKLSDTLRGWVHNLPSKQRIKETLGKFVQQMDEPEDPIEQFAPRQQHGAVNQQSFYKTFNELQSKAKNNGTMSNPSSLRKGKGKGKHGANELPKFDLQRAFPQHDVLSWQRLCHFLECGETPKTRQKSVVLCQSVGQIIELQEMAKAWGEDFLVVNGASLSIILVAAAKQGDPTLNHAKEALLPFIGNIAMLKAVMAELNGKEVQFEQSDPKKISMKTMPVRDLITLRVHIALDYVDRKHRDHILQQPAYALSLVGVEDHLKEAKTFQWTSAFRMISGYVQIPSDKLQPTMARSGHGGVFFQKLARDGTTPDRDVEWHPWKKDEGQSYFDYHQAAMERAAELKSFLTIRKGGGSNLGIVTDHLLHRDRHWALFGIQYHSGPNSVSTLLKELGWDVVYRPTEPSGKNRPWIFYGKPKDGVMQSNYTYAIPAEGKNDSEQYIRISTHSRHRKMQDEDIEYLENKKKWWDVEVAATLRFEPEVAPTVPDSPEAMQVDDKNEKTSPAKKKMRKLKDLDITKRAGPGGHKLEDLGGCGDCAYRCIAYGLAYLNAKGFTKDPAEEEKVKSKVKELGQVLRVQAVTQLLTKDTLWQESWAQDDTATECTEAGAVPTKLEQFKVALKREQCWACGLTLQVISNIKKVNLIVFEDKANQWIRTGLITCEDGASTKTRKSLVLVLHEGHYYLVKALSVDAGWLSTDDVVWCSKSKRPRGFFSRGGVAMGQTPSKNSFADLEELCKPCSTVPTPGKATPKVLKDNGSDVHALRACSSKRSPWTQPGKSSGHRPIKKDLGILSKIRTWTCKICGFRLEGISYKEIRGKIDYHLHRVHEARYREIVSETKKLGMKIPGLSMKHIAQPILSEEVPKGFASFECPWCGLGIPDDIKGLVAKKSKRLHLQSCKKRPRKIPPLWKFHHDGIRKMRGGPKNEAGTDLTGHFGFEAMGHKPVRVKVQHLATYHKGRFTRRSGWFCKSCLACTIGSPEALRKKCKGNWAHKNCTFWKAVHIGGGIASALKHIENEDIKQWIKATSSQTTGRVDHGHQLVRVLINHKKKFGQVCRICNAASYGSITSFYSRCKGKLAARSLKFWQAVEKQGNLEETLALMSENVGTEVKKWIQQEATGQIRGHSLITLQVDINNSSRKPVRTIKLCKRCNACSYGTHVVFAEECAGQLKVRSNKAWLAIRKKGIFKSTMSLLDPCHRDFVVQNGCGQE